jgi:manganese efflux pump family protein
MGFGEICIIAVGLALDAFAVSLCSGKKIGNRRGAIRLSFHLGLFQFLMPVIGWYLGVRIAPFVQNVDHWIAFGLLLYIGLKMMKESFDGSEQIKYDPSKGKTLVALSVATSIDALVVGFSLAMVGIDIWRPAIIIGIITALLSIVGIYLGKALGAKFGRKMEFIGGLIIIGIGTKILFEHFLGR